jgi:hypothetical protein
MRLNVKGYERENMLTDNILTELSLNIAYFSKHPGACRLHQLERVVFPATLVM